MKTLLLLGGAGGCSPPAPADARGLLEVPWLEQPRSVPSRVQLCQTMHSFKPSSSSSCSRAEEEIVIFIKQNRIHPVHGGGTQLRALLGATHGTQLKGTPALGAAAGAVMKNPFWGQFAEPSGSWWPPQQEHSGQGLASRDGRAAPGPEALP